MSETAADVNIGEYLAHRIDLRVKAGLATSREELVRKAIIRYLEDLDLSKLRSELFHETMQTREIMLHAWKEPIPAEKALDILASLGQGQTKKEVDLSIDTNAETIEKKYGKAFKELQEFK